MRANFHFCDLVLSFALLATCQASRALPADIFSSHEASVGRRALPDNPGNGYAPATVDCPPARPTIREASSLSPDEQSWLQSRRGNTVDPMADLLSRAGPPDFDARSYLKSVRANISNIPNIGIAVSGGGYRAMLTGAGAIKAFDSRTENSTGQGGLGGLLQSSTYLAGLSGGSWLVGSVYTNNFTSISDFQSSKTGSLWQLGNDIIQGPAGTNWINGVQSFVDYWHNIIDSVAAKRNAGFPTTITDYWGRALSYQLIDAANGGPQYTFSSISEDPQIVSGQIPMPIIVADGRAPGETIVPGNTTIFEFNPWEFGSFDPSTYGFAPMRYIGSNFSGGAIEDGEQCIRGFDSAGFVMGTSSSLFNAILLRVKSFNASNFGETILKQLLDGILSQFSQDDLDIADYKRNPFYGWRNGTNNNAQSDMLTLVDGGEDGENTPFHPLIQPMRQVDVIFAIDAASDVNSWPNGTALIDTYRRSLSDMTNGTSFPSIPDQNTIVKLGLNKRPTFFGCDSKNQTGPTPIVVWLANAPYSSYGNTSTFQLKYTDEERDQMIENGYDVATAASSEVYADFSTCVGCAILSRALERNNQPFPQSCQKCFKDFCWNGTLDSSPPATPYAPIPLLGSSNPAPLGAADGGSQAIDELNNASASQDED